MRGNNVFKAGAAALTLLFAGLGMGQPVFSQEQSAAADASVAATSPDPLSADEMEILVARIALYPDELIAVITAASLYPLQIVEAARYLDQYATDKSLKPKDSWDGSVISLLNYPEVVKMMSKDLEWTQSLGDAIAYQQKDVLIAIQQLRDEAVVKGAIKTDDKIQVVEENDNVVIKSADPEKIYVPQYEPQMLYEPNYAWQPISYYPDPYPNYWYPGATFFAGAVTGAIWAAAVDWDDWGVWGGHWDGGDIDIDCNDCFNNREFNGKVNINDVDWKNVDRSKINIDRNQLNKLDQNNIKSNIERNPDNSIHDRAKDIKKRDQVANRGPGKTAGTQDLRKSTLDGLKGQGGQAANRPGNRPGVDRPAGKPKPGAKVDNRPKKPSGVGDINRGKTTKVNSNRGHKSMGGGNHGGGGHKQVKRPSGGGGGGRRR
jgi:hypothetical protein